MQFYAVSYQDTEGVFDGYALRFFSTKKDAIKLAREFDRSDHAALVFEVIQLRVPTKKSELLRFLEDVNSGVLLGEPVAWRGDR